MDDFRDLYPFLGGPAGDTRVVVEEARRSTLAKAQEIADLRRQTWERNRDCLVRAARLAAGAFSAGAKALAFGNGGSATDALDVVRDLAIPPRAGWRALPAFDLTRDTAVVTALANDIGFDSVYLRQIIAFGAPGDIALGFSTSGRSASVNGAFAQAKRQGMIRIGFSGYDGGAMAEPALVDALVIVPSTYIPRIQEAQATAWHMMLTMTQALLSEA